VAADKLDRPSLPAVVHLSAEYFPYARTGGLAEAVSGLASIQHRAGHRVIAMLPLYRSVRELATGLVPAGDPFPVQVGPTTEMAQLFRVMGAGPGPEVYAIAHPHFYDRPGIYGTPAETTRTAPAASRSSCWPLEALPRFVTAPRSCMPRLAHRAGTAVSPHHARPPPGAQQVRTVLAVHNPDTKATSPPRWCPRWACRGGVHHHCLEW
jgi:hypothetical protein